VGTEDGKRTSQVGDLCGGAQEKLLEKRRIYETEIRSLGSNEIASFNRDVSPRAFDPSLRATGLGWRGWRGE
jgi:hypothetical protein